MSYHSKEFPITYVILLQVFNKLAILKHPVGFEMYPFSQKIFQSLSYRLY